MMLNQKREIRRSARLLWLVCAMTLPLTSFAELLDSIDIKRADGMAVIKITLSHNVRYRRHFPQDRGNIVNIYFDDVALENAGHPLPSSRPTPVIQDTVTRDTQREEYLRSPPNDLLPFFWVAYLRNESGDTGFEPYYIAVQFSQTTNFSLRADENNRAFYIYVPISQHQDQTNRSTSTAPAKATTSAPATPNSPAELTPTTTPAISSTPTGEPETVSPP